MSLLWEKFLKRKSETSFVLWSLLSIWWRQGKENKSGKQIGEILDVSRKKRIYLYIQHLSLPNQINSAEPTYLLKYIHVFQLEIIHSLRRKDKLRKNDKNKDNGRRHKHPLICTIWFVSSHNNYNCWHISFHVTRRHVLICNIEVLLFWR